MDDILFHQEYERMGHEKVFTGRSILNHKDHIKRIFNAYDVQSVLDYGCGQATCWTKGQENLCDYFGIPKMNIYLYDKYVTQYNKLTHKQVDATVCIDVVEHIPEKYLDNVFKEIFERTTKVFIMTFCNRPAKKKFRDGTNLHVTMRDGDYWLKKVQSLNDKLTFYIFETK